MSTDYYFKCRECNLRSNIAFSRQAWGWGSTWPTNAFSFIIKHTNQCGEECISCISENEALDISIDNNIEDYYKNLRGFTEE